MGMTMRAKMWATGAVLLVCSLGGSVSAQSGDDLMKMIPADAVFCARINNFDQTLAQLDQFLLGVSPVVLSPMAKMQLGQVLGNAALAGLNTAGDVAIVINAPAPGLEGAAAWADTFMVLVPVTDFSQFVASSPSLGKPDAGGVCEMAGMGAFLASVGKYAMLGPAKDAASFALKAKSVKAGPAKSIAGLLDAAEASAAVKEPLWMYVNIQALSKALGPGISDKIRQMGAMVTQARGGMGPNMGPIFNMYAGMADTLLKEGKSAVITLRPQANCFYVNSSFTAVPGTEMAGLLTRTSPVKDWTLTGYLEDGTWASMAMRLDPAWMSKCSQKLVDDMVIPMLGPQASPDQVRQLKAMAADAVAAMGSEMAFSMTGGSQPGSFLAGKGVYLLKDKDKFSKLIDEKLAEVYGPKGLVASMYDDMGLGMTMSLDRKPDTSYQGATVKAFKFGFSSKDPSSPEAQMIKKMYGEGLDNRVAVMDNIAVLAMGNDADATVKKLVDQVKAGGPKQTSPEFKAAMDLLPEAKNADIVYTINYLRMIAAVAPAMSPTPMPAMNVQSKSNLVLAGTLGKGRVDVQVALPKEHVTEIMQVVPMMMQGMQQGPPSGSGAEQDTGKSSGKAKGTGPGSPKKKASPKTN